MNRLLERLLRAGFFIHLSIFLRNDKKHKCSRLKIERLFHDFGFYENILQARIRGMFARFQFSIFNVLRKNLLREMYHFTGPLFSKRFNS